MTYIYDIVLNFNNNYINFFEWNDEDSVLYLKKITIFKVDTSSLIDFIKYRVNVIDEYINNLEDTFETFDNSIIDSKLMLITDGSFILGVKLKNGFITEYSSVDLINYDEIINIVSDIDEINIKYKKVYLLKSDSYTRYERNIIDTLSLEFKKLYNDGNIDKLKYYYYEYFGRCSNNIDYIYKNLVKELHNFNDKILNLYNIYSLSFPILYK